MAGSLEARPRWPDKKITVDKQVLDALYKAQALLPSSIQLVITRAYQAEGSIRKLFRTLGKYIFVGLYPARHAEADAIFGHNGHATDGNHIDVSLRHNGQLLHFLPLGVFTPLSILQYRAQHCSDIIKLAKETLATVGFRIHPNHTEALQIHCDFIASC